MSADFKPHKPVERVEIYTHPTPGNEKPFQVLDVEASRPGLRLAELLPHVARQVTLRNFWAVLSRSNDRLRVQRLENGALRASPV